MTEAQDWRPVIETISKVSDSLLEPKISARLAIIAATNVQPDPYEIKRIMDECVYEALASGLIMQALHIIWENRMKEIYP